MAVRIILAYADLAVLAICDPPCPREICRNERAIFNQLAQHLVRITLDLTCQFLVNDRTHTRHGWGQRYIPEPAAIECDAQYVTRIRSRETFAVFEISEEGYIAEKLRILSRAPDRSINPALMAGSIYNVSRMHQMLGSLSVLV